MQDAQITPNKIVGHVPTSFDVEADDPLHGLIKILCDIYENLCLMGLNLRL